MKEWKGIYIYSDMHEIFLVEFPCMLHEWLKSKDVINLDVFPVETIVWDQANIDSLKVLDNRLGIFIFGSLE
jgi:hypothetical protein